MTPLFSVEAFVTQYFGHTEYAKKHYKSGYHEGLDVVPIDRVNYDLYSSIKGVCKWAGWGDTYGYSVIIFDEHHGMSYHFCHLDGYEVSTGDNVNIGDKIGVVGNTGNSSGRHLHLNAVPMYEYGKKDFANNGYGGRVDPLGILRAIGVWI